MVVCQSMNDKPRTWDWTSLSTTSDRCDTPPSSSSTTKQGLALQTNAADYCGNKDRQRGQVLYLCIQLTYTCGSRPVSRHAEAPQEDVKR